MGLGLFSLAAGLLRWCKQLVGEGATWHLPGHRWVLSWVGMLRHTLPFVSLLHWVPPMYKPGLGTFAEQSGQ